MNNSSKTESTTYGLEPEVVMLNLGESFPRLYAGIAAQVKEYGWGILDLRVTHGHILPGLKPIGLLTSEQWTQPLVQRMRDEGYFVLRIGHLPNPDSDSTVPAVLRDLPAAGRLAAEHFAERGFKHLAFVGNAPGQFHWYQCFLERGKELGCTPHLFLVTPPAKKVGEERFRLRLEQMADWLLQVPKPIGVLTYNDRNAATIFTAARLNNLACPEDVALLGVGNDSTICDLLPVPLSSVDTNEEEHGRQAVIMLKRFVDGESALENTTMIAPKGIVERQSTNLLAVPDPVVARALRFIWDHYDKQLSVEDVVAIAGVSRSSLCDKFKQCLGRGINAELRRKRLEQSARLLRSSQMTVAEVADATGFPSLPYLFKVFREEFGVTPKEFRQKRENKPENEKNSP